MILNQAQNMMLGIAIGDAFGATYGVPEDRRTLRRTVDASKFTPRMKNGMVRRAAGMYTDETQQSIAIVELLLSGKEFTPTNLADFFVLCYKRDPLERAYSTSTEDALKRSTDGSDYLRIADRNKTSNGAAMRAVPLGILPDIDTVVNHARINAETSHNTPEGIATSIAVALMSHYSFTSVRGPSMREYVEPHVKRVCPAAAAHLKAIDEMVGEDPELLFGKENVLKGVPMDGIRNVGAVLYILSRFDTPIDVLQETVFLGGFADCTTSIALGINLIKHDVSELPPAFFEGLTNTTYGRDYLLSLGDSLTKTFRPELR